MSTAIAKNFQVGSDGTATNNFTIRQPATPDGTVRIANGNSGTTTDLVTVTSAGNVGVGTTSPGGTLHLVASSANFLMNQYSADSLGSAAALAKSRGTIASPSAVLTGDSLALFSGGGYNTSSIVYNKAAVQMYAAENWTTTANGSYMTFATTAIGATGRAEAMRITSAGDVGIGTSSPGAKLDVNGALRVGLASNPTTIANNSQFYDQSGIGPTISGYNFEVRTGNPTPSARMIVDSAGNVGIGTSSPGAKLEIGALGVFRMQTGSTVFNTTPTAGANDYLVWNTSNSGSGFAWNTNSTERVRITPGGNLGVGTTTINYRVVADCAGSSSNDNGISVYNDNNSAYGGSYNFEHKVTSGGSVVRAAYISSEGGGGGSFLRFATTNASTLAERIRITSGGDLLVGTTIGLNGSRFYSVTTGNAISGGFKNDTAGYQTIQVWNAAASGTRNLIQFNAGTGGTNVGLVTSDGTNTTYGTSSDYRLKENIQPMIGALEKVAQLKPCIYTWKATGAAGQGFIAHELQNVVPDAVVGEKDAVNEDGSIRPQNIDTSFLVATLTAAIQELKAELDSVKTELALLKGTA